MALPRASNRTDDFSKHKETIIALRAEKRAAKAAEKKKQAEELKEMGDDYFRRKEYITAVQCYTHAVHLNGNQPTYMSNLAAALVRLERFEAAEAAAHTALLHDPKSLKARYLRGLARRGQTHFHAAILDFENVIAQDPTNADALAISRELYQDGKGNETGCDTEEEEFPPLDAEKWEIETESDTSDYQHDGNGVPCRYYNHGGCKNGSGPLGCMFKHSPDDNSMRDKLGRNVCLNFATGTCKYDYDKCRYSHDVRYLDDKRFITASQKVTVLEFVLRTKDTKKSLRGMGYRNANACGKIMNAPDKKQNPPVDENSASSAGQTTTNSNGKAIAGVTIAKTQSPRVDNNKASTSDQSTTNGNRKATADGSHKKLNTGVNINITSSSGQTAINGDRKPAASGTIANGSHKKQNTTRVYSNENSSSGQTTTNADTRGNARLGSGAGSGKGKRAGRARQRRDMEERMTEERMMNRGFTDDEMNELLCQGVKPWNDDASDVLHALNAY
ncbi:hypothetical protein BD410DRAFT_786567 [Rickenella mellea]|uniref:C3H1-type domain-containing protein n=1 Tax=Rickenella mellea TaxID=50990 RepID=A0A4Y7QAK9_9AGAM|nr:hypothetical protein BD410DRAFT_786567 [Rickenella mellea]